MIWGKSWHIAVELRKVQLLYGQDAGMSIILFMPIFSLLGYMALQTLTAILPASLSQVRVAMKTWPPSLAQRVCAECGGRM
jgi:hypothetical protein